MLDSAGATLARWTESFIAHENLPFDTFLSAGGGNSDFSVAFSCPQQRQEGDFITLQPSGLACMKLPERDGPFCPVASSGAHAL